MIEPISWSAHKFHPSLCRLILSVFCSQLSTELCFPARCLLDTRPQSFGSARAAILSNFAEMMMWVLEGPAVTQSLLVGGDADEEDTLRSASMPSFQLPRLRIPFSPFPRAQIGRLDSTNAESRWVCLPHDHPATSFLPILSSHIASATEAMACTTRRLKSWIHPCLLRPLDDIKLGIPVPLPPTPLSSRELQVF